VILKNKVLHIVSFDVPYPADYGGVIDVFYKLKGLKEEGLQVILHCFSKNRSYAEELTKICKEVHYYRREMNPYLTLSRKPFIVSSRKQESLLENLLSDQHPVLFEGLHTTYFLKTIKESGKRCYVRTHNIEHDYYMDLAKAEKSFFKRNYFKLEGGKLKKYEDVLVAADGLVAISERDEVHFKKLNENTIYIPPFHPEPKANHLNPDEKYAFYHGNFEVAENRRAVKFLLEEILPGLNISLVLAGKAANSLKKIAPGKNITIVNSPSEEEMLKWASGATVHLLPTFQPTGYKLKLLYSLYTANSIVANDAMLHGTGLEKFAARANSVSEWKKSVREAFDQPASTPVILKEEKLREEISNSALAKKLIQFLR